MLSRKLPVAATVLSLVGLAAAAGAAHADSTPAAAPPASTALPLLTFVPPKLGPITVAIGPTIIGGKVMDPGLKVSSPGISLPPITWSPPS